MTQSATRTFPLTIHAHWRDAAASKGFDILKRIRDRYHLLLRCRTCGATHVSKLFVLMNNRPECPHCIEARWRGHAKAAGLQWAGRDPENRHYGLYIADCGHRLRRQLELVKRAAAGICDVRCETCHTRKEQAEAEAQGWELIGSDPEEDPGYRHYLHPSCGHVQRIARVNMQTGRFGCGKCGDDWPAAPSHLYAMQFKLPNGAQLVKLGFSRNPDSRLRHQLLKHRSVEAQILKTVPMETGQLALQIEKRLHAKLKSTFPDSIASPVLYAGSLNVRSEIYFAEVTREIVRMLDEIATDSAA
ncbi:GIY-YIG nuclease family protein [Leisingera aquaemixtae]|uniref:GIY-YIG nuclease family protein n=1 Tax=Leisingera aquaemixtae TaxID=1396826 RepID=A0ABY5WJP8_9RHOB|nr:GIY-YIG nuclease family protein [Leisingera aquaemixtae]UWQ41614.1 GIY-YIG nuclease family protein [Leisingera aquaemixtae]